MKRLILQLYITLQACYCFAQTPVATVADLKFDQSIIFKEQQWVVKNKRDSAGFYPFGFTYVDINEGFVFQKVGDFKINDNGKYTLDKTNAGKVFPREYIMKPRHWQLSYFTLPENIAVISPTHFKELKIVAEPAWVKSYYNYTDTLAWNYKRGKIYGTMHWFDKARGYFEAIYKVSPHYPGVDNWTDKLSGPYFDAKGVEISLAGTYFQTEQFDKAIKILTDAIAYHPDNVNLYASLGSAYDRKKEWALAIDAFKRGMALIKTEKSQQKYWFAGCISNMYEELKDDEQKKYWRAKSDEFNPYPGMVY